MPGSVRPWLELRTPGGETVYTFDQVATPALVCVPTAGSPARPSASPPSGSSSPPPGEPSSARSTARTRPNLPTVCPSSHPFLIKKKEPSASTPPMVPWVYSPSTKGGRRRMSQIFPTPPAVTWTAPTPTSAAFTTPDGTALAFHRRADGPGHAPRPAPGHLDRLGPGQPTASRLCPLHPSARGRGDRGPERRPARFFVQGPTLPVDWRQLTLPADAVLRPGDWQIIVGLYNPADGPQARSTAPAAPNYSSQAPDSPPPPSRPSVALIPATCGARSQGPLPLPLDLGERNFPPGRRSGPVLHAPVCYRRGWTRRPTSLPTLPDWKEGHGEDALVAFSSWPSPTDPQSSEQYDLAVGQHPIVVGRKGNGVFFGVHFGVSLAFKSCLNRLTLRLASLAEALNSHRSLADRSHLGVRTPQACWAVQWWSSHPLVRTGLPIIFFLAVH